MSLEKEGENFTWQEQQEIMDALIGKVVSVHYHGITTIRTIKGKLVSFDDQAIRISLGYGRESEIELPLNMVASVSWTYEKHGKLGEYTLRI